MISIKTIGNCDANKKESFSHALIDSLPINSSLCLFSIGGDPRGDEA